MTPKTTQRADKIRQGQDKTRQDKRREDEDKAKAKTKTRTKTKQRQDKDKAKRTKKGNNKSARQPNEKYAKTIKAKGEMPPSLLLITAGLK